MKYIGSKAKISKYISPIINELILKNKINTYIEPFVGGANMIEHIKCTGKYGYDNENLVISLLNKVITDEKFLDILPELPTREHYYDVRDNSNYDIEYKAAILYFASYNSRINGGCYGACANTKEGGVRNYFQEAKRNLQKQIPKILDVNFIHSDYKDILVPNNSLIYCDPPYEECHYKDKVYSGKGFNHEEFWNWVRVKSKNNNVVLISEYNAPDDFECIWETETKTHMDNTNKLSRVEKLFQIRV
jgi:DNA adenine methylase